MRSGLGELITEVNEVDQQETVPLGRPQWMGLREATQRLGMPADNLSDRLRSAKPSTPRMTGT